MPKHYARKERERVREHRQAERSAKRRRRTLKTGLKLFFLGLLGVIAYSVLVEPRMMEITEHEVPIEGLPWAFDGFTIVQLSDLHMDIWIRPKHVRRIVRRVNALQPDLVALTGDYISRSKSNSKPAGKALSGLRARHGVYAVLGNHDYWVDAEGVTDALRESGIDVLFDESHRISIGEQSIWLAGVDDVWEGSPDYKKALAGIPKAGTCIALAHNPDAASSMRGRSVDFLMTGHTHGGLVNLPWKGPLFSVTKLGPKYSSGMFQIGDVRLYVSRGIGTGIGAPTRFRCRPEVSVFTLRRAER